MKILVGHVCKRHYVAYLEGRPEICCDGESFAEAVGELIYVHHQRFNIEVQSLNPDVSKPEDEQTDPLEQAPDRIHHLGR